MSLRAVSNGAYLKKHSKIFQRKNGKYRVLVSNAKLYLSDSTSIRHDFDRTLTKLNGINTGGSTNEHKQFCKFAAPNSHQQ